MKAQIEIAVIIKLNIVTFSSRMTLPRAIFAASVFKGYSSLNAHKYLNGTPKNVINCEKTIPIHGDWHPFIDAAIHPTKTAHHGFTYFLRF